MATTNGSSTRTFAADESGRWHCPTCTYNNHPLFYSCAACNNKPSTKLQPPIARKPRRICVTCTYNNDGRSCHCAACGTSHEGQQLRKSQGYVARAAAALEGRIQSPALLTNADSNNAPTARRTTLALNVNKRPHCEEAKDGENEATTYHACSVCYTELKPENTFTAAADCKECSACSAQWAATQISDGNSYNLKCLCGKHALRYKDVRSLHKYFPSDDRSSLMKIYDKAMYDKLNGNSESDSAASAGVDVECPECNEITKVTSGAVVFECHNTLCPGRTGAQPATICVKHMTRHTRPHNTRKGRGVVELDAPRRCARCIEEKSGNGLVRDAIQEIQNAFVDRCPSCHAVLGDPQDFTSCMCLRCSHCPKCVCGFCYDFHAGWTETHQHVCTCSANPRENLYVESETVWRGLMRQRRIGIQDSILTKYKERLTSMQMDEIRKAAAALL